MQTRINKLILAFYIIVSFSTLLFSPKTTTKSNTDEEQGFPEVRQLTQEQFRHFSRILAGSRLPDQTIEEIDRLLRLHSFNGTVALARGGDVLYRGEFGLADFRSKRPISLEDQFQLASVSKQFTAMAVMMLAENGHLDYDDLFVLHVPEFPYPSVTIRQLLNHTAGMPNYMSLMERNWKQDLLPQNEDMLHALSKYKPGLNFTPGRRFDYSNTGYALLALLVERLGKRPFDRFLEDEIFVPLGMWDTYIYSPTRHKRGERQLIGHRRWRRSWMQTPDTLHEEVLGDKGIYSTVEDMLKWDRALFRGSLVSAERLREAFEPLTLQNGRHWLYGFGFRIEENTEQKVVFHYGRWNSFSTCIFRDLDSEYTLIMLSNVKRNLDPLQQQIRSLLPQEPEAPPLEKLMGTLQSLFFSR